MNTPRPHRVLAVALLLALGTSDAAAQAEREQVARPASRGADSTYVIASRNEVRVVFPADTMDAWGWSGIAGSRPDPRYQWLIVVKGLEGSRFVRLIAGADTAARTFPSLRALVAAGEAGLCLPGLFPVCEPDYVRAEVHGRNVVLVIHDPAVIRSLFALRPPGVDVYLFSPHAGSTRPQVARVTYVDPQVPLPTADVIAQAESARREEEARPHSVTRSIGGGGSTGGELWIVEGDSVRLEVEETRCRHDVCTGRFVGTGDSTWSVDDDTVARIRVGAHPTGRNRPRWRPFDWLVALRPGRTRLRVDDPRGVSDTIPSCRSVPTKLERVVVVTRRISHVSIAPMADSARVGERHRLDVRVYDVDGNEVAGAPVGLRISGGRPLPLSSENGIRIIHYNAVGTWTIIAAFAGKADTAQVLVRDTARTDPVGQSLPTGQPRDPRVARMAQPQPHGDGRGPPTPRPFPSLRGCLHPTAPRESTWRCESFPARLRRAE